MYPITRPSYSLRDVIAVFRVREWARARHEFEESLREFIGLPHIILTPYARTGLFHALRAVSVPGEDIAVSSYTCVVVPQAIVAAGNRPRFLEPADGWVASPEQHGAARVEIVTHLFGRRVDLRGVPRHGRLLIEDSCLAWAPREDRPYGDLVLFSMNLSKQLTTANGGVLATDDDDIFRRVQEEVAKLQPPRLLDEARQWAVLVWQAIVYRRGPYTLAHWLKRWLPIGTRRTYSLDSPVKLHDARRQLTRVQCLVGLRQLRRFAQLTLRRREIAHLYLQHLRGIPGIELPAKEYFDNPTHMLILCDRREELRRELYRRGVNTGIPIEYTCARLPAFLKSPQERSDFSFSQRTADRILALPFYVQMREHEPIEIAQIVREAATTLGMAHVADETTSTIDVDLVVVSNAEQYFDGEHVHVLSGLESQTEELARRFRHGFFYSPAVKRKFEGYTFGDAVTCLPLCDGLHRSHLELSRKIIPYCRGILGAIRRHRHAVFLAYIPDSYIGILALLLFRLARVRAFYRVTNDVVAEFLSRRSTTTRKIVAAVLGPIYNAALRLLLKGQVCFFSGHLLWGREEGFYPINTVSLTREQIHIRETRTEGPFRAYFVGRFDEMKGLRYFLEAARHTPADVEHHVIGYGTPDQEAAISRIIAEYGITKRVRLHGYVPFGEKLFAHLRSADFLIVPSVEEYQGKVPVEGMAFGCCVIAARVGGITKIVKHLENGILVEPRNAVEIANAVTRLVNDAALRRRLVAGGYRTCQVLTVEALGDFILERLQGHGIVKLGHKQQSVVWEQQRQRV